MKKSAKFPEFVSKLKAEISEYKKRRSEKRGMKFLLCPNFIIYAAVLLFALIFTQALRSPLSGVLYVFTLVLPFLCLIHLLTAIFAVRASAESSSREVYKLTPCSFEVTAANDSIIPYPFAEAVIHIPDEHAVRCVTKRVWLSMAPRTSYDISQRVIFSYRGNYSVGISSIYVYDFLRLFRLRLDFDSVTDVFVMPRRLTLDSVSQQAPSDINTDSSSNVIGVDRSELSDIRAYRIGDHMKTIHWQLSSKTQELVVKEFAMNSGKTVYIFADLNRAFDTSEGSGFDGDINEFAADGIVELSLAAASRELHEGNGVTMLWYDDRAESGMHTITLQTPADLGRMYKTFATTALLGERRELSKLAVLAEETQNVSMVFVTSDLSSDLADGIISVASAYGNIRERGAISVIYSDVSEKVRKDMLDDFNERRDAIRLQLEASGISVTEPKML